MFCPHEEEGGQERVCGCLCDALSSFRWLRRAQQVHTGLWAWIHPPDPIHCYFSFPVFLPNYTSRRRSPPRRGRRSIDHPCVRVCSCPCSKSSTSHTALKWIAGSDLTWPNTMTGHHLYPLACLNANEEEETEDIVCACSSTKNPSLCSVRSNPK